MQSTLMRLRFLPSLSRQMKCRYSSSISGTSGTKYGPVDPEVKRKQEVFQLDNGLPVHLKGGPMDNVFYCLTLVLSVVGCLGFGNLIYELGWPKKSK